MDILHSVLRLLTFQMTREEMLQFNRTHLITGLVGTWIVGMGRYWDDSGASILQHAGLGSVVYIFVLSGFIWLIILPFRVREWRYDTVLTFIGLTSFPAIFYAIPVEKFFTIQTANSINAWFLGIVAVWRLLLLNYFLQQFTQMSARNILTVTFMPICLIISTLTILNLHRAVFEIMGGIRNPTPHDTSYLILLILTGVSMILTVPLLIAYGVGIYFSRKKRKNEKE